MRLIFAIPASQQPGSKQRRRLGTWIEFGKNFDEDLALRSTDTLKKSTGPSAMP
jgi:hypothetical protein